MIKTFPDMGEHMFESVIGESCGKKRDVLFQEFLANYVLKKLRSNNK